MASKKWEEPILYEGVFKALGKSKVKYLVAGGVAVNLHGFPRFTQDLDLMIHLEKSNVDKFVKAVKALGFYPRVPVKLEDLANPTQRKMWKKQKGALVLTLDNKKSQFERIDIFLDDPINFDEAYKKRKTVKIGVVSISLISLEDLIHLKEKADRPIDRADMDILKRLKYRKDKE